MFLVLPGVNLAMAKSPAGQQLDLINIMAYDAGNKASTGGCRTLSLLSLSQHTCHASCTNAPLLQYYHSLDA